MRKQVLAGLLLLCAEGGSAQPPAFRVDWAVTPESGTHRTEYTFTAVPVSGSAPYAYIWNFGDGSPDEPTTATVRHTFYRPGTYTVQLTGRDGSGQVVVTRKPFVVGTTELAVDCEVVGLASGVAPLRVELRATPENCVGPCSWKWESGDGQVVLGQNYAEFDYRQAGTFRAKVTLEDALTFTPEHYERRATCEQVIRLTARGEPGEPGGSAPLAPARFAYVTSTGSDSVTAFAVNASTGMLTPIGAPVPTGSGPTTVVVTPSGRFAYVANFASNDVSMYSIAATGALTSAGTVAAGVDPGGLAVAPGGAFAYVVNEGDSTITRYSINPSTGVLSSLGTTATSGSGTWLAIAPSGRFGYVSEVIAGQVEAFAIDAGTGGLASLGTVAAGSLPTIGTVDPSGRFAYFPASGSNAIFAFSVNPTTGGLTSIGGSPFPAGTNPFTTVVDPGGRRTYTSNTASGNISIHTIDSGSGALTSAGTVPAGGVQPVTIALDPSGRFAYSLNFLSDSIAVFTVDQATGGLTLLTTVPIDSPRTIAFVK